MAKGLEQGGAAVAPLGAGDLLDRSVRFYRRFFWTFLLIASPPVVVGTIVSVAWTAFGRELFTGGQAEGFETFFYQAFTWLGNVVIWLTETVVTLIVMGGASRNFVRHLLFGEAITFRETYRNVVHRLGGLIVASATISIVLGMIGLVLFYVAVLFAGILVAGIFYTVGEAIPVIGFIGAVVIALLVGGGVAYLFFFLASGVAYVPQVMLVEGLGVLPAIGRSVGLAGGSARRLAALFTFSTVAAYSALAILYVPVIWYASYEGVELMSIGGEMLPAWYVIATNLIGQISFVLLSPVWMIGLCLLYVDTRVRREGYDLEIMAATRLGEMPSVPQAYVNPLQPALASVSTVPGERSRSSVTSLDLNG